MINTNFNALSQIWAETVFRASWQSTVAVVITFAITTAFFRQLTNKSQCWLWRVIFLKLLLLALISNPPSRLD